MELFRIRYTEVTVCYMNIEADSEAEAEEFLDIERAYHRSYASSLLCKEVIDKTIEPIFWEESGGSVILHEDVEAWMDAYERGSLSVMNYCIL